MHNRVKLLRVLFRALSLAPFVDFLPCRFNYYKFSTIIKNSSFRSESRCFVFHAEIPTTNRLRKLTRVERVFRLNTGLLITPINKLHVTLLVNRCIHQHRVRVPAYMAAILQTILMYT